MRPESRAAYGSTCEQSCERPGRWASGGGSVHWDNVRHDRFARESPWRVPGRDRSRLDVPLGRMRAEVEDMSYPSRVSVPPTRRRRWKKVLVFAVAATALGVAGAAYLLRDPLPHFQARRSALASVT